MLNPLTDSDASKIPSKNIQVPCGGLRPTTVYLPEGSEASPRSCGFPSVHVSGRDASCPAQIQPEDRLSHPSSGRQQSDSWCHRKFGHAGGNSCFVANWRKKRPGTRTYWPNPGHTLSVRKKV